MRALYWRGCLAQLGEHRPYKARVGGSNPSAPTNTDYESERIYQTRKSLEA